MIFGQLTVRSTTVRSSVTYCISTSQIVTNTHSANCATHDVGVIHTSASTASYKAASHRTALFDLDATVANEVKLAVDHSRRCWGVVPATRLSRETKCTSFRLFFAICVNSHQKRQSAQRVRARPSHWLQGVLGSAWLAGPDKVDPYRSSGRNTTGHSNTATLRHTVQLTAPSHTVFPVPTDEIRCEILPFEELPPNPPEHRLSILHIAAKREASTELRGADFKPLERCDSRFRVRCFSSRGKEQTRN